MDLNARKNRRPKTTQRRRPARSVGGGASRRGNLSERAEELLVGLKRE